MVSETLELIAESNLSQNDDHFLNLPSKVRRCSFGSLTFELLVPFVTDKPACVGEFPCEPDGGLCSVFAYVMSLSVAKQIPISSVNSADSVISFSIIGTVHFQTTGDEVNLAEDSNARFKAVQENTHVVVNYFDLRTQSYHEKVLKPVFGVSDYWYRYEFAKSRGQIHWHQLSWRDDRHPHQLLHEAREGGCGVDEYAARLSQWADENFATTALQPAGSDKEGQPRKDLWPPPEVSADPISDNRDPLVKMLIEIAATQDAILEDHLLLVN